MKFCNFVLIPYREKNIVKKYCGRYTLLTPLKRAVIEFRRDGDLSPTYDGYPLYPLIQDKKKLRHHNTYKDSFRRIRQFLIPTTPVEWLTRLSNAKLYASLKRTLESLEERLVIKKFINNFIKHGKRLRARFWFWNAIYLLQFFCRTPIRKKRRRRSLKLLNLLTNNLLLFTSLMRLKEVRRKSKRFKNNIFREIAPIHRSAKFSIKFVCAAIRKQQQKLNTTVTAVAACEFYYLIYAPRKSLTYREFFRYYLDLRSQRLFRRTLGKIHFSRTQEVVDELSDDEMLTTKDEEILLNEADKLAEDKKLTYRPFVKRFSKKKVKRFMQSRFKKTKRKDRKFKIHYLKK